MFSHIPRALMLFLFAIPAFAGFQIVDVEQSNNGGHIQIHCESGTKVELDSKPLGRTGNGDDGFFIQNISPGLHIVKTKQTGFAEESWPVQVKAEEIAKISTTESSPISHDEEARRRIQRSHEYTESKQALVGRNAFLEDLREENTFELVTEWGSYANKWPHAELGRTKKYDEDPDHTPRNLRHKKTTIIDKKIQDEDGRYHNLVVTRETDGYAYSVDEGNFLKVDFHYYVDLSVTYQIIFDDTVIEEKELTYSAYDVSYDEIRNELRQQSNSGWERSYEIYPIELSVHHYGEEKPHASNYVINHLQHFARLKLEAIPDF